MVSNHLLQVPFLPVVAERPRRWNAQTTYLSFMRIRLPTSKKLIELEVSPWMRIPKTTHNVQTYIASSWRLALVSFSIRLMGNTPKSSTKVSCASVSHLTVPYRKIPWRLSSPQKARQRKRLRAVDKVVDTVSAALAKNGLNQTKAVQRWYTEMPREQEMLPKDKYTIYDRKEKTYRKGIHSMFFCFYSCLYSLSERNLSCATPYLQKQNRLVTMAI